jgi:hypothetical protein
MTGRTSRGSTPISPQAERWDVVVRAWEQLIGVGAALTAAQRHLAIRTARRAWSGSSQPPIRAEALEVAAHWVARDPGGLSEQLVVELETAGLDRFGYLEVVGVVARLANVDFYLRGLGMPVFELPTTPADGAPTGDVAPSARITNGWVPATGPLFAPAALNALPSEAASFLALHEPMYVPFAEFANGRYADELTRVQIEYVAARTSYLNECFY